MKKILYNLSLIIITTFLASCEGDIGPQGPAGEDGQDGQDLTSNFANAVYAMTNNINGNTVQAYGADDTGFFTTYRFI